MRSLAEFALDVVSGIGASYGDVRIVEKRNQRIEIKNGKKIRMLKNPSYGSVTPEFWNSCDAICNQNHWVLWGIPNCGKGQPSQVIATGHGAAPARFRKINVGVGYS